MIRQSATLLLSIVLLSIVLLSKVLLPTVLLSALAGAALAAPGVPAPLATPLAETNAENHAATHAETHAETNEPAFKPLAPETQVMTRQGRALGVTEWRYQDNLGEVGLHRYRFLDVPTRAMVFYLPGTHMNGTLKTLDENQNLWIYLAARGIVVYTLDYRTRFVSHDVEGSLDRMLDWTVELFVDDAERGWKTAHAVTPGFPAFVAGFSRGAAYAYLLAARADFSGVIALDGSLKSTPAEPFDLAAALARFDQEARPASVLSRRGFLSRDALMQAVMEDPDAPALDDRYDSAGHQLSEVLYQAWGPGVLTNTREAVTDIQTLAREMRAYDWFFPRIQDVEQRAMAEQLDDPTTPLDDHFGSTHLPVLYFGTGKMDPRFLLDGIYSASALGKPRPEVHVLERYGHLDVLFARDAADQVFAVIDDWITRTLEVGSAP